MAAEPGGIGSKLGGFYERRYAIEKLLGLVAGRVVRLRWEPRSGEAGGADIQVERASGVVEHIQLKRQNRADAEWTIAVLDREHVLRAAAEWLDGGSKRLFTFVSSDPVPHLKDICDQLRRHSGSAREFVVSRVYSNQVRRARFEQLLKKWSFDPDDVNDETKAIARLRRMRFVLLDRSEEGCDRQLSDVQRSLTGEPSKTVSYLKSFLEKRLGQDIRQQDLIEHLRTLGVLPRDLARDPSLPSALFALRN
ncbi:MAG: hypothetical protein V3T83_09335, partial [Acidobacteriota bacterium]